MSSLSPFLLIACSCEQALLAVRNKLERAGLHAIQTFDLHAAREGSHDCACPHHGTQACDCQMVVLLVYGSAGEPVTLTLHGSDGQTWLSLAELPRSKSNMDLANKVKRVL